MSPIPRFHPATTSSQTHGGNDTARKLINPPPRTLETLTVGCKISFVLVFPRYALANADIEGTAKNIVREALSPQISLILSVLIAVHLMSTSFQHPQKIRATTTKRETSTGK